MCSPLLFVADPSSLPPFQFEPRFDFPATLKSKAVYFMKPTADMVVTKDNVMKLIRGDVAPSRVDALVRARRSHPSLF
jgi:hypothetical protein